MQTWETIRLRGRRDGEQIKPLARALGIAPNTVRKYLRTDMPPIRKAPVRTKLLDHYQPHIDELLRGTPKITAKRIGDWLRANVNPDCRVGERTLREYVAARRAVLVPKEAFIRAAYAPAQQSQFDFSPMKVNLAGSLVEVQLFVLRLSYSGRFFARASMREDQPALFAGLLAGFSTFGGLTRRAIFDNAKTAVKRVLRGTAREENEAFRAFRGGLGLEVDFAQPAKGNEKGGVEGCHGFIEDNFFRPMPSFATLDELNAALQVFCLDHLKHVHSTHRETIAARFAREQPELLPLPAVLPRTCITRYAHINKFAEVKFDTNRYSTPTRFAHQQAIIEIYEDKLRIIVGEEVVAEHRRGFGKDGNYLDPAHYVDLLASKHRSAETAFVLQDGRLPRELHALFERYRCTDPRTATKRWTEVLKLLAEAPLGEVAQAVTHAVARGTADPAAIALLLRQRMAPHVMTALDPNRLPEVARIQPATVDLSAYATSLLAEGIA